MPLKPRPYQAQIIEDSRAAVAAGQRRLCIVSPTGSGKTIVAALIIGGAAEKGRKALFLAHRRELIRQTSAKLHDVGVDHGILLPGYPVRLGEPVQVASVATLHARAIRGGSLELPAADVVYVDECHHVAAKTYQQIIEAYPKAVIIGLTATPARRDGRGLGSTFDRLILGPAVQELIDAEYLVGTKVFAPTKPDLDDVHVRAGDYVEAELADRVDKPELVGDIVSHWHRLGERRRTVVFASSVGHSVHLRDEFRRSGVVAEHVDGTTPTDERDEILAGLARGAVDVICNFGVLTEGWDSPSVGCIILARPTKHHGLFRQMVGRGLRPSDGKTDCILIDHAGATYEHGLIEDPVEWFLSANRRAELPAQKARASNRAPALVECPQCGAIRLEGRPCSSCGWRPRPRAETVEIADGELTAVDRKRRVVLTARLDDIERRRWHAELLFIAEERGYQRGWAAYKFKEKFGNWPDRRDVEPKTPSAEVRSWVRSRQIAYANARQKAAAA
jgi:DNA repair protein RadD